MKRSSLIHLIRLSALAALMPLAASADQPPAPCHPNPNGAADMAALAARSDVVTLPAPLKGRLLQLADRPHTYLPLQVFAEASSPSQLFQYYLLDTGGFQPNVFTARLPGINDKAQLTVTGGNCGLSTVGAVRIALEPKAGLPTDPTDPRAFIDIFTDVSNLFVINNESGWYEGWMIHDLTVPAVAPPRGDRHAAFGTITAADAARLKAMGSGNNVPGHWFTVDGNAPHWPTSNDSFPARQTNVVPIQLSMGAYNSLQQSDAHSYWEFNYTTNWVHPPYELAFAGGFPDHAATDAPDTYRDGEIGREATIVPGLRAGENRNRDRTVRLGDNPDLPRDPDKFDADDDSQREFRQRFLPSGLVREIYLDVYLRLASFEPGERNLAERVNKAIRAEVKRVDANGDGVISASEGDIDSASDGFATNDRLFLSPTSFNRFAVTREINDGYLAPRFAPSQRAWVVQGAIWVVNPAVPASAGRDGDDR